MTSKHAGRGSAGLLTFNYRGGAVQPLSLYRSKDKPNKARVNTTFHQLTIAEHRADFLERSREFSRTNLLKKRSVLGKAFGASLRHYRKLLGYSQEDLALICGIDRTYPSLLERGLRTPSIAIVIALACALKITPLELYCTFLDTLRDRATHPAAQSRPVPAALEVHSVQAS